MKKSLTASAAFAILFAILPLFTACGDGADNPAVDLENITQRVDCAASQHYIHLLDRPVPVGNLGPATHLQAFTFSSCLTELGNARQHQDIYDALEIVVEELKQSGGFTSEAELKGWMNSRIPAVMEERFPTTYGKLVEANFGFEIIYEYVTIEPRKAGPGA